MSIVSSKVGGDNTPISSILFPQHLADLRRSGLSDEQIAKCGFYSCNDIKKIGCLLRWKSAASKLGPCLIIPFFDHDGKAIDYVRIKPDNPRVSKKGDGRKIKYEAPLNSVNRAYIPPVTRLLLADQSMPLLLTEGEKKAAKADQEGFACIGLLGVYGFQLARDKDSHGKGHGPRMLIPDMASIAWQGRKIIIVFDSDIIEKPGVRWAEWHLAETLQFVGAEVLAIRIPPGRDGAKQGLDDFLVNYGPQELQLLIDSAKHVEMPHIETRPNDELDNPHRLAIGFRESFGGFLRFWRGDFYHWRQGAYCTVENSDIRGELTQWVRREFMSHNIREIEAWRARNNEGEPQPTTRKVSTRLLSDAMNALQGECLLTSSIDPPAWICGEIGPEPVNLLPLRNGILDISTNRLLPLNPNMFTFNVCSFSFTPRAQPPCEWLKFLLKLWPDDPDSIATLQEWFGYLLTPDTRQQKILFLLGPKRSGKGTICRVLSALIGMNNVAGPTLGSLATNFGLSPLLRKTVAIVSDARLSGRDDAATITERLLSISGEDALTVDRKHRDPLTVKLLSRFVIATNELPRLGDASGALAGRLILLRFTKSFFGIEDHGLTDRLLSELPGILNWALEGWRRLRVRGRFLQPASGAELMSDLEDLASPVGAFVRERCRVEQGAKIEVAALYSEWRRWCEDHGRREPGTEQTFGRDLRAAVPSINMRRLKQAGERWRVYVGIRLRVPDEADDYESGPRGSAGSADSPNAREAKSEIKNSMNRDQIHTQQVVAALGRDADLADPTGPEVPVRSLFPGWRDQMLPD